MSVAQKEPRWRGQGKRALVFLAKAHAAKGDHPKAVAAQTVAMEGTEDWENAEDVQKHLCRMKMHEDLEEYKARAKAEAKGS